MKTIRYYISVAAISIRQSIQSRLEYPFMLIGHVLANCIQWVIGFATIKFVVDQFGSIGGWGYESLAFLYGMSVLSHGLAVVFFIQTWGMGYWMIDGEFDRFLLRPMNLIFQFLFDDFNLIGFTDIIPGLMVFVYGCVKVHLTPSCGNILLILCTLAGGTLIRGERSMFACSPFPGFWPAPRTQSWWSISIRRWNPFCPIPMAALCTRSRSLRFSAAWRATPWGRRTWCAGP